ncbi:hypothetical protein [Actinorugispora endophytica]|uniref:Uncharacterized protein n=1 Tax=Actinorugispora endophytica TaxID=1605990 RepID=A0A4R6UZ77_9ACTN|nr:hypothetical protein [Actinorugispora endophytica]TDQ51626.1 hypothetical protein EV190_110119 [Actinorugispora endophytica]
MREATVTGEAARSGRPAGADGWVRWTPWAAVAWSLLYAVLGGYWAVSGRGFPYAPAFVPEAGGPVAAQFGTGPAWAAVAALGLPAAALGAVLLYGPRTARPLLLGAGSLVSGALLLLMTDANLLAMVGYLPYATVGLVTGSELGALYLSKLAWPLPHQLLCLVGGLLWCAAAASYALRTAGPDARTAGWTSPAGAARWGRYAVLASLVVPVFYATTRIAWALGFPLGITEEFLRLGQEAGLWTSGLFLALFALAGAVLTLGLTQRWGEVFPRWMIGLAGRRVPVSLAVVPASAVSALLVMSGLSIWSGFASEAGVGQQTVTLLGALPTLLLPLWGTALAAATLGYVLRRRGA